MTIQEILDNILHAVFGRDVRQSLHDGVKIANDICTETEKRQTELEKKYNEQIKNMTLESPSDAEIVDARIKPDGTTYETLGARLNETDKACDEVTGAKSKADGTTYETLGDRLDAVDDEARTLQEHLGTLSELQVEDSSNIVSAMNKLYSILSKKMHVEASNSTHDPFTNQTVAIRYFTHFRAQSEGWVIASNLSSVNRKTALERDATFIVIGGIYGGFGLTKTNPLMVTVGTSDGKDSTTPSVTSLPGFYEPHTSNEQEAQEDFSVMAIPMIQKFKKGSFPKFYLMARLSGEYDGPVEHGSGQNFLIVFEI